MAGKRILLVVDYQNDFVCGSLGFAGAEALEGPICAAIEQTLATGGEVAFTFDTHGPDYLETQEGRDLPVPHCIKGTEGWALYGKVADARKRCGDAAHVFEKPTFGSLELANFLQRGGYDRVELCGLVSNICVLSNAILARAALPQATVCVNPSLTAAGDPVIHQKALDVLQGMFIGGSCL